MTDSFCFAFSVKDFNVSASCRFDYVCEVTAAEKVLNIKEGC